MDAATSFRGPAFISRSAFVASPYAVRGRRHHLTSLERISILEDKETIAAAVLFGDHDVDRMLAWQRLCDVSSRMEMKMTFRLGIVAGLIGLTIGCSSYSPATPSGGTGATGTPVSIVRNASGLTNTAYAPNPIAIGVGETITWINNDSEAHTSAGDDGSWNSGTIAAGASFSRTFPSAGSFSYHCTIHPNMIGVVTVR
jgi:plastocyanin